MTKGTKVSNRNLLVTRNNIQCREKGCQGVEPQYHSTYSVMKKRANASAVSNHNRSVDQHTCYGAHFQHEIGNIHRHHNY